MMARKPGNPNWGKPDTGQTLPTQTSFEETVKAMKLTPKECASSAALREWVREKWVRENKDQRYVPSNLLKIWGFEVRGE
jgi:hypothetical protein